MRVARRSTTEENKKQRETYCISGPCILFDGDQQFTFLAGAFSFVSGRHVDLPAGVDGAGAVCWREVGL
jgi:hypothetical protein